MPQQKKKKKTTKIEKIDLQVGVSDQKLLREIGRNEKKRNLGGGKSPLLPLYHSWLRLDPEFASWNSSLLGPLPPYRFLKALYVHSFY